MVLTAKACGSSRASAADWKTRPRPRVGKGLEGSCRRAAPSPPRVLKLQLYGSPSATRQSRRVERTASAAPETHGFASLPRGRFAFIVCNHRPLKERCRPLSGDHTFTLTASSRVCQRPFFTRFRAAKMTECGGPRSLFPAQSCQADSRTHIIFSAVLTRPRRADMDARRALLLQSAPSLLRVPEERL
jgi:hypothetical protein